jgi:hypothetical protein
VAGVAVGHEGRREAVHEAHGLDDPFARQGDGSLTCHGEEIGDEELVFKNAREVCRAAAEAGITVTLDMEDHTTTDSTLRVGGRLRAEHPATGLVIQASLRRSEDDCRAAGVSLQLQGGEAWLLNLRPRRLGRWLLRVRAPTLLIVGGSDDIVLEPGEPCWRRCRVLEIRLRSRSAGRSRR